MKIGGVIVTLSPEDMIYATGIGYARYYRNRKAGVKDRQVSKADALEQDALAAQAELAVGLYEGHDRSCIALLPQGAKEFEEQAKKRPDTGTSEVRSRHAWDGGLLLHDDDLDDVPFVFVRTPAAPAFWLVGWLPGHYGKKRYRWAEFLESPCYLVPAHSLIPMEYLPRRGA